MCTTPMKCWIVFEETNVDTITYRFERRIRTSVFYLIRRMQQNESGCRPKLSFCFALLRMHPYRIQQKTISLFYLAIALVSAGRKKCTCSKQFIVENELACSCIYLAFFFLGLAETELHSIYVCVCVLCISPFIALNCVTCKLYLIWFPEHQPNRRSQMCNSIKNCGTFGFLFFFFIYIVVARVQFTRDGMDWNCVHVHLNR